MPIDIVSCPGNNRSTMSAPKSKYYDKRSDFWKEHFGRARTFDAYLKNAEADKAAKWTAMSKEVPALSEEQKERITLVVVAVIPAGPGFFLDRRMRGGRNGHRFGQPVDRKQ